MDPGWNIILLILLMIIILTPIVVIAGWSINDARLRGKSPFVVCCAVLFFFPWGWIAWLLFRPSPVFQQQAACGSYEMGDRSFRRENALGFKRYKEFMREFPEVSKLSSKERHDQFRLWDAGEGGV